MVDLELDRHAGNPRVSILAQWCVERAFYLYSTPSLIVNGFFLEFSTAFGSVRFMLRILPGGSVAECSSSAITVTCYTPPECQCRL
jgi:hypothetical protein